MLTPEQSTELQRCAQNLLDGHDFSTIRTDIEAVACDAPEPWTEARTRKLPIAASFGHLICTRAIVMTQTGTAPEVPSDADPHERYLAMTVGPDQAAADKIMNQQSEWWPTLHAALEYFRQQINFLYKFGKTNPQFVARRGILPASDIGDPANLLVSQITSNAKETTMMMVIREALRICLREQSVPAPAQLARELIANVKDSGDKTHLPTQIFIPLVFGNKHATAHFEAIRAGKGTKPRFWNHVLRQVVEQGTVQSETSSLAEHLHTPIDEESKKIVVVRLLGLCAASFYLRPPHHSGEVTASAEHINDFFGAYGMQLNDSAFRLVDYQLLRGITAAEHTIFDDPKYRAGLSALVRAISAG